MMTVSISLESDTTTGQLIPVTQTYTVRSVHTNAINMEASDSQGPYFVSLIRNPEDWTEYGILVSEDRWNRLRTLLPTVGQEVHLDTSASRKFRTEQFPGQRHVRAAGLPPLTRRQWAYRIHEMTEILRAVSPAPGFLPLLFEAAETIAGDPGVDPFLRRAATILGSYNRNSTVSVDLSHLVGLGTGFTPSGDDFICGAMSAEWLIRATLGDADGVVPSPSLRIDPDPIRRALARTTTGGATLLRLALASLPPEYIRRFTGALIEKRFDDTKTIAESHGHSSGLDALTGFLWFLDRIL